MDTPLPLLLPWSLPVPVQSVSVSVAPLPTVILPLIVCPFRQRVTFSFSVTLPLIVTPCVR